MKIGNEGQYHQGHQPSHQGGSGFQQQYPQGSGNDPNNFQTGGSPQQGKF